MFKLPPTGTQLYAGMRERYDEAFGPGSFEAVLRSRRAAEMAKVPTQPIDLEVGDHNAAGKAVLITPPPSPERCSDR
jgi:hypothetical protein